MTTNYNDSGNGANPINQAQSFQITSAQAVNISLKLSPGTSVKIPDPSETILNGITISPGVYKNLTEDVLDILNPAIDYTPWEVYLAGLGSLGDI